MNSGLPCCRSDSLVLISYESVLLHCIDTLMTRVVCRPFTLIKYIWSTWPLEYLASCFKSSDCHFQHFCDVCKYMFRMDQANGHNNQCSNRVFKVYAYCHHCSTVHEVPHILCSTMLCLSNSSLSNTIHHSVAHPHFTWVINKSTFYHSDIDMLENNHNENSKVVDNDSNCLRDTSDCNESSPFSKVLVPMEIPRSLSMDWAELI